MHSTQRGFTLIEIVGAMAIGSIMLIGLTGMIDTSLEDAKGQQAALYQAQVAGAAAKYIETNYSTLLAAAGATPVVVTLANLTAPAAGAPYLSPNTAGVNAYGQTPCVLVHKTPAGKLDALIVTYGGQPIEDRSIASVAANAGQGGGYIKQTAWGVAQGASWSLNGAGLDSFQDATCLSRTAADGGHLVSALFFDGPGQLSTDFLYRSAVPGRPELNTMNSPISLADKAVVNKGDACGATAAIAVDASKDLLRCDSDGLWNYVTTWKGPKANYASLMPTTDKAGDVRMVLDQKRAFMYDGSGNWVALAVDQNGDLAVPRDVNVGRDVNAKNNVVADVLVHGKDGVRGAYVLADTLAIAHYFYPLDVKSAGQACNIPIIINGNLYSIWPINSTVADPLGLLLLCGADSTFRYANGTYSPT